jgi:hypothetical protein
MATTFGTKIAIVDSNGYLMLSHSSHPLAGKRGRVYQHRVVLFEKLAGRDAPCAYCKRPLRWFAREPSPDRLYTDHVNAIRGDNRPENLVPVCRAAT